MVLSVPVAAQEADDLRLDTGDDLADLAPPPPPPSVIREDQPAVRRRRRVVDPNASLGISNGPLTLYPELEAGVIISSNPARRSTGKDADAALRLKPKMRLESNWSRHQLSASTEFEYQHFVSTHELSNLTGNLGADLRLDVRRGTTIDLSADYTLSSSGAFNSEVPDSADGNRVDQRFELSGAITHNAGIGEGTLRLGIDRQVFGDVSLAGGGTENNDDRDYTEVQIAARATLNTGAVVRPFLGASYTPRFHDETTDRSGLRRNSHGYGLTAGLRIDDDPLWTGELAATYLIRDYVDGSLGTEHVPGLLANIKWRPTELTSVDFNASVALTETASVDDGARASWSFGVGLAHALRDSINVFSRLGLGFENVDAGTSVTANVTTGLEWQMTPTLAWRAAYEGTWFNGPFASDAYDDQRLIASLILRR